MILKSRFILAVRFDLHSLRYHSFARPLRVLFYGSDNFSLATLKVLDREWKSKSGLTQLAVVTGIKRPPNAVHSYSEKAKIPYFGWPTGNESGDFDIGVVVSFSHLIPQRIIDSFPLGMINLHSSLLPRWRGAAPIIYSLMAGDKITGVTVMKVEPKHYDVGNIIAQKEVAIDKQILLPSLHDQLSSTGAHLMLESLRNIEEGLKNSRPQPTEGVSYAPKVEGHALSYIDWSLKTATEIFNLFRALYGFRPILTGFNEGSVVVKLLQVQVDEEQQQNSFSEGDPKGAFVFDRIGNRILVKCAGNSILSISQLQVMGKKPMTAVQFMNGFVKKKSTDGGTFLFNKVIQR